MKFYTVESIAMASDAQLQTMGMKAGMNPLEFRKRAQNYLKVAKDESVSSAQEAQILMLQEENASIRRETDAKLEKMQEQMAQLLAAVGQKEEPKKRGNPNFGKKPEAEAA